MSQPVIQVTVAISPPTFSLGSAEDCTLTINATLQHTEPITMHTWGTIFALPLAQVRHNFFCVDLSSSNGQNPEVIKMNIYNAGKRAGMISRQLSSRDDQYWVTFYPGKPVTFTDKFVLADPSSSPVCKRQEQPLTPGHRYHFGFAKRFLVVYTWQEGTREDLLTTEKESFRGTFRPLKIELPLGEAVKFDVKE